MKILLLKDVKNVGKEGEIKDVKDGYGKNFIVSRGLGKIATDAVIKQYEAAKKRDEANKAKEVEELKEIGNRLKTLSVTIKKSVGDNGHLFGAVTKEEISFELKKQHKMDIDKKQLSFDGKIKSIGVYAIDVKLGNSISSSFKLDVTQE